MPKATFRSNSESRVKVSETYSSLSGGFKEPREATEDKLPADPNVSNDKSDYCENLLSISDC